MGDSFENFNKLPSELRNAVWGAAICSPGLHAFKLGRGIAPTTPSRWKSRISSPRYRLWLEPPLPSELAHSECGWTCAQNPSAYAVTNKLRLVSRESRGAIDLKIDRHSQWTTMEVPLRPTSKLILNMHQDVVHLQTNSATAADQGEWFDPSTMIGPLAGTIIGSAFPLLRNVKKVALSWNDDQSGDPMNGGASQIRRDKNMLWAPAHFPLLDSVYLIDDTVCLSDGRTPDRASEIFYGNGYRFVEVLTDDLAWCNAGSIRPAVHGYQADYLTALDAERWLRAIPMSRKIPQGSLPVALRHPKEVPSFWPDASQRQEVVFKILACVVD